LRKWIGDDEFVVGRIVSDIVHGSPQQCFLSGDNALWQLCSIRQPGECRNLRVSHSVRHQNLIAL
jgi:hypothetical protein